jgi:hypothetical protein
MSFSRNIPFTITSVTVLFLFLSPLVAAQEKTCPVDLPVGLIDNKGTLLEGLTPQDLTIRQNKQSLAIQSVKYDSAPRRILLLMDTSARLPVDARKAEVALARYLLSRVRAADSFALLTARGPLRQVHFEEGKESILRALQELSADPKEAVKGENILDTMVQGMAWFGQSRPGDAILIMADHLEESNEPTQFIGRTVSGTGPMQGVVTDRGPSFEKQSKIKFSAVTRMLAEHQMRVFGLQLGALKAAPLAGKVDPNDENLFGISLVTGGFAVFDPVDSFGSYVLTESRLQTLQDMVWRLYATIAQFYVVRVESKASHTPWKLELAKDLRSNTRALYPQQFDPCAPEMGR